VRFQRIEAALAGSLAMRTVLVLVLALGLVAFALGAVVLPSVEAHAFYCDFQTSCIVKCTVHGLTPGHRCVFIPVP
jgi:hypothetical protein